MTRTHTKKDVPAIDPLANLQNEEEAEAPLAPSTAKNSFPFETMNLRVGDRLQAQPPAKVSTERFYVSMIGYLQDQSLLITTPLTSKGMRLQLIEGDQLVMRVFAKQNAFGFACDVQRVCKLPYSYLHISFPKEVQGTLIRKAPRIKTKIIAKVRKVHVHHELTGVISNLSASGALLDGRHDLSENGETLHLDFRVKLHNIEAHLSLTAIVKTVFTDKTLEQNSSTLAHFGLEFVDLKPNDQMVLQSMVYQQMIERPQLLM